MNERIVPTIIGWKVLVYFPFDGDWQERHNLLMPIVGAHCEDSPHCRLFWWFIRSRTKAERLAKQLNASSQQAFVATVKPVYRPTRKEARNAV